MAKVLTAVRPSSIFRQTLAIVALALLLLPASTIAAPYGSDGYGACGFGDGCAAETTSDEVTAESTGTIIVLNTFEDFFVSSGVAITDLEVGDEVEFCIRTTNILQICEITKETHHTVKLKSVNLGTGTVVVTIASTPTDYTLTLNTPTKIDVDKDESDDIEVTLTGLSATSADITYRSLGISTPAAATADTVSTDEVAPKTAESSNPSWLWWLLGSIGVLVLLAIIRAIIKKRRGGGSRGSGYGSGPMGDSTSGGEPSNMSSSSFTPTSFTPDIHTPTTPVSYE